MLLVYWNLLLLGVVFAVVTLILGEIIGHWLDSLSNAFHVDHLDYLQPVVVIGGLTCLGAIGVLLTKYTSWSEPFIGVLSLLFAVLISMSVYFGYVKKMAKAENSIGHSTAELVGKIAEVSVPIPSRGYGEIIVKTVSGYSNYPAISFEGQLIKQGNKVVIVELRGRDFAVSELNL
ncbi:protease [Paenibacillus sp. N1-5-1-14]|uniref:protease n=1 Tax=Paenibacillus radicibacter TaxID=2972488 RepID=UPI0021590990|nr:protease [Paenibacillus radicibacter]MCR8642300.1 protease [Paenibacillus radicibacter]